MKEAQSRYLLILIKEFSVFHRVMRYITSKALLGHTVFALGSARIFELIFWLGSFKELSDHSGLRIPGYLVLLSQIGHLILLGDFFYYYFKSISRGLPMELPTTYSGIV